MFNTLLSRRPDLLLLCELVSLLPRDDVGGDESRVSKDVVRHRELPSLCPECEGGWEVEVEDCGSCDCCPPCDSEFSTGNLI